MAFAEVVKESLWLRGLVSNLTLSHKFTIIHCDSWSYIHLAKNQMYYERSRHINVKYNLILDIISSRVASVKKIAITENLVACWRNLSLHSSSSIAWTWLIYVILEMCMVEATKKEFKFFKLAQFKLMWKFVGFVLNYRFKWEKKYSCT
jgi:hypothetical protein